APVISAAPPKRSRNDLAIRYLRAEHTSRREPGEDDPRHVVQERSGAEIDGWTRAAEDHSARGIARPIERTDVRPVVLPPEGARRIELHENRPVPARWGGGHRPAPEVNRAIE